MLFAVMFCYLFYYTGRHNFGWAIEGVQQTFNVSKQEIGWASAVMLWAYGLGQFINGNLGDKYGARVMMTLGAVLSVGMNWAASFAPTFMLFVLFWGFNGYAQSLGWAPASRLLSNWWSKHERGKAFGFFVFSAGCSSILIFLLSILINENTSDWRILFRLPVLLLLIGAVVFYFVSRNKPEDCGFEPLPHEDDNVDEPDVDETSLQRYRSIFKNTKFMLACLAIGFQSVARYGLLYWVPVYYIGSKLTMADNVWVALALPIGMAFGTIVLGQASDRLFNSNRSRPIKYSMLIAGVVILMLYFVPQENTGAALVLLFLAGFFVYGPQSCFWPLSPDLLGTRRAGTGVGVMNAFAYGLAGLGEPFIGWMIDYSSDKRIMFAIVGICCFFSASIIHFVRR